MTLVRGVGSNWDLVPLRSVTVDVPSWDPSLRPDEEFLYVDISSIDNHACEIVDPKRLSGREAPSRARRPIMDDDVLFSNVRTYLRNVAQVRGLPQPAVASTGFTLLRPTEAISSRYLFHLARSDFFISRVTPEQTGTHYPATSDRVVRDQLVPLPPRPLQDQLAQLIDSIESKRASSSGHLSAALTAIERFRQAVLAAAWSGRLTSDWRDAHPSTCSAQYRDQITALRKEAWSKRAPRRKYREADAIETTELPQIPESWDWLAADAVCSQITDGEHIQPPYQTQGYPMLSAKHVRDGFVDSEGAGLISESAFAKALERCAPAEGDLLIVSVGATTGRSAIVDHTDPFAIVRSVLLLKPLIPSRFLLRWLQGPYAFTWMRQASGASAQPHLYIRDVRKLPVPFPPMLEQLEIVRRVDELFALADSLVQRLDAASLSAERSSQAVLAKAFRGELLVASNGSGESG